MDQRPQRALSAFLPGFKAWVHVCERCGARMEERQCKIICPNCGSYRDCSDP